MTLICRLGLHSWNGCKCTVCGKIRNTHHDWKNDCDKCSICGKTRDNYHDWTEDCQKCSRCGKRREVNHVWEGCKCTKCNKTRNEQHDWSKDCEKCYRCGQAQVNKHNWIGCKCSICGKTRDEHHDWDGCLCTKCGKTRNDHHVGNSIRCHKCNKPIEHIWDYDDISNFKQPKKKILKALTNSNAIISFMEWQYSDTKKLADFCYSYELQFIEKGSTLNFLLMKNGPILAKLIYIHDPYIIFYEYLSKIYYSRPLDDVKSIVLYEGSSIEIQNYLYKIRYQQKYNPEFDPVFKNDPTGIFGAFEAKRKVLSFQSFNFQIFALNLLSNDSNLFDQSFFNSVLTKTSPELTIIKDANKLFNFILKNNSIIYDLIIERGILYNDVKHVSTFSNIK